MVVKVNGKVFLRSNLSYVLRGFKTKKESKEKTVGVKGTFPSSVGQGLKSTLTQSDLQ